MDVVKEGIFRYRAFRKFRLSSPTTLSSRSRTSTVVRKNRNRRIESSNQLLNRINRNYLALALCRRLLLMLFL